jgi:hypothetical protein
LTEVEEKSEDSAALFEDTPRAAGEISPKRRMPRECEALSDVQAYTMLNSAEDTAGIQS